MNDIVIAAREYLARGWAVLPIHGLKDDGITCACPTAGCQDGGKHVALKNGFKGASKDPAQIEAWFGKARYGLAIATGAISGITVIDIDIGTGKHGAETWAALTKGPGEPVTLMSRTGGGGMHAIFAYNSAMKSSTGTLGPGIDCRNDDGYIIAPPSPHKSGRRYAWIDASAPIGALPAFLLGKKAAAEGSKVAAKREKGPRYGIEAVRSMLLLVGAEDRDTWRKVGVILGRYFERSDPAWDLYVEWSDSWKGKKGRNHDEIMQEAFHVLSQETAEKELSIGTIVKMALEKGWEPVNTDPLFTIQDIFYHIPAGKYIYLETLEEYPITKDIDVHCPPKNVDGKLVKASDWVRKNTATTSATCTPLYRERFIEGMNCCKGELVEGVGRVYNMYRHPLLKPGDPAKAEPWLAHVRRLFNKPGDADQFLNYMAHRAQSPGEKPRFALLIAGMQGTGKDTAVDMCVPTYGQWNVKNVDPAQFDSPYNEYVTATLIRISEAANLHDMSQWTFNERIKVLIAGNPDVATVNQKYGVQCEITMHCGVVMTTNHLLSGIYIPPDDRRYDVIESATLKEMGLEEETVKAEYFKALHGWFAQEKDARWHVAAFLKARDLTGFSASMGQRKTAAHRSVVQVGLSGDAWMIDIIAELGEPVALRGDWVYQKAMSGGEKASGGLNKKITYALDRLGYVHYHNNKSKDGRWKINGVWRAVYLLRTATMTQELMDKMKVDVF